jgi:Flp pilus assembly protein TadD
MDGSSTRDGNHAPSEVLVTASAMSDGGSFASAVAYLDRAAEFGPLDSPSLTLRGWCLENLGLVREAATTYRAALRIDAGNLDAVEGLANVSCSLGDRLGAIRRWVTVAGAARSAQCPSARTLELAGWSLYRLGRLEEADRTLRRALEMNPCGPSIRFDLGLVLLARGKTAAARIEYERSLALVFAGQEAVATIALEDLLQAPIDESIVKPIVQILADAITPVRAEIA